MNLSTERNISGIMKINVGLIAGLMLIFYYSSWLLSADYMFLFLFLPTVSIFIVTIFIQMYRMINTLTTMLVNDKTRDFQQIVPNGEFGINNSIDQE